MDQDEYKQAAALTDKDYAAEDKEPSSMKTAGNQKMPAAPKIGGSASSVRSHQPKSVRKLSTRKSVGTKRAT